MICFVVNKQSGNGKAYKVWKRIERLLQAEGTDYKLLMTNDADEACAQICRLAAEGAVTAIAVVGGDGTIHGVLPAVLKTGAPLGIIPAGSGNDLARALGIPSQPETALAVIRKGHTRKIDCLEAHGIPSATVVGIGLDAAVAYRTNHSRWKKRLGKFGLGQVAYVFNLLRVLAAYRARDVQVDIDGRRFDFRQVWLLSAGNTPYFGGGMKICPEAVPDDRLLDICIVHGISRFGLLRAFPLVYRGGHLRHPNVRFVQGRRVTVETEHRLPAHGDGEHLGTTPIRISVHDSPLHVLVPGQQ